jgi:hypothetical protein
MTVLDFKTDSRTRPQFLQNSGGSLQILQDLQYNELFFYWKMRGPIPRVRGPVVLSVDHGPEQWSGGGLTRAHAQGRSGEWELTASWGIGRGAPRGPHHGYKRVAR